MHTEKENSVAIHLDVLPAGKISILITTIRATGRDIQVVVFSAKAYEKIKKGERARPEIDKDVVWEKYQDAIYALIKAF